MAVKNIMIVGVGGQGTLLTSRILGGLALAGGYDVKLSEVHGMAQRGGSVVTFVRYGDKVAAYRRGRPGGCDHCFRTSGSTEICTFSQEGRSSCCQ